ncbi:helix-turn-helix domain-containing protein [Paenibacillus ehimensis]|uniref:Helix-turn-helix transcriptional regulator n=1 Tax=Paenibacillus ehimensis TaxID=79264 RepID=A0ABT8V3Y5_9BACL|nr:helix-turn-helix transcriptional regulator [Paenibacillus ehimensis]MDO3676137.1 helix-turn-helix transcriptional regulator [Paenibacillus ehimensis]
MVDIKCKTISDIIFQLRKEKNLTYAELEELTGVGITVLHKIETGATKRPEFKTLKAITKALPSHYTEIMKCYIEEEDRVEILFEILQEVIALKDDLAPVVALRLLQSPQRITEDSLQRLFDFTETVSDDPLRASLFTVIVQYSRERGVPYYVAKGLLQKYMIERNDLKRLEESFRLGQEITYYVDFLSLGEKVTFYFRMALHAYNIKKYSDCIQFCEEGLLLEKKDTELKARAYLSMLNSLLNLEKYDEVEIHLDIFEKMENEFVVIPSLHLRALIKARKKEYEVAIPILQKYLNEFSRDYKIHIADELLEIYLDIGDFESIPGILEKEHEFLPEKPKTPQKYLAVGKYFRHKGFYQLSIGLIDEGMQSYVNCFKSLEKVGAYEEKNECIQELLKIHIKLSKSLELKHIIKLKEAFE